MLIKQHHYTYSSGFQIVLQTLRFMLQKESQIALYFTTPQVSISKEFERRNSHRRLLQLTLTYNICVNCEQFVSLTTLTMYMAICWVRAKLIELAPSLVMHSHILTHKSNSPYLAAAWLELYQVQRHCFSLHFFSWQKYISNGKKIRSLGMLSAKNCLCFYRYILLYRFYYFKGTDITVKRLQYMSLP